MTKNQKCGKHCYFLSKNDKKMTKNDKKMTKNDKKMTKSDKSNEIL